MTRAVRALGAVVGLFAALCVSFGCDRTRGTDGDGDSDSDVDADEDRPVDADDDRPVDADDDRPVDAETDVSVSDGDTDGDEEPDVEEGVPMCEGLADCLEAVVRYSCRVATDEQWTFCMEGLCGLATEDFCSGELGSQSPASCDSICGGSTYDGRPMRCVEKCSFGGAMNGYGRGTLAGHADYVFSDMGGGTREQDITDCSVAPPSRVSDGGNSYLLSDQSCCCEAVP